MEEKDPRHPSFRSYPDKMEDVGLLDTINLRNWLKELKRRHNIDLGNSPKICDVGSGEGTLLNNLDRAGFYVVGIEPRTRKQDDGAGPAVIRSRVEDVSQAHHAQYDLVIVDSALDPKIYGKSDRSGIFQPQAPHEFVTAVFRLLRPGGVLLYAVRGSSMVPTIVYQMGIADQLDMSEVEPAEQLVFQKK